MASTVDDTQALELFRNMLEGDFDGNTAVDLLRALDYIRLAITQAEVHPTKSSRSLRLCRSRWL
jgi:hypothetical protein